MADESGIPEDDVDLDETPRPRQPVEADVRLLVLARSDDSDAATQLYNRYYSAALHAATASGAKRPDRLVATTFRHELTLAGRQNTRIGMFLTDWFAAVSGPKAVEQPSSEHKAINWAFYAMAESDRALLWHRHVDGWPPEQLATVVGSVTPDALTAATDRTDAQFKQYVTSSSALLAIDPPTMTPPTWIADCLSDALAEGTRGASPTWITPAAIIAPASPLKRTPVPTAATAPSQGASGLFGRIGQWWGHVTVPVRIVGAVAIVAIVVGGGTAAWARYQYAAQTPSTPPVATPTTSHTPTPSRSTTPTPTPTVSETPSATATPTPTDPATTQTPVDPDNGDDNPPDTNDGDNNGDNAPPAEDPTTTVPTQEPEPEPTSSSPAPLPSTNNPLIPEPNPGPGPSPTKATPPESPDPTHSDSADPSASTSASTNTGTTPTSTTPDDSSTESTPVTNTKDPVDDTKDDKGDKDKATGASKIDE